MKGNILIGNIKRRTGEEGEESERAGGIRTAWYMTARSGKKFLADSCFARTTLVPFRQPYRTVCAGASPVRL